MKGNPPKPPPTKQSSTKQVPDPRAAKLPQSIAQAVEQLRIALDALGQVTQTELVLPDVTPGASMTPGDMTLRWAFEATDHEQESLFLTRGQIVLPELLAPDTLPIAGRTLATALNLQIVTPLMRRLENTVRAYMEALERMDAQEAAAPPPVLRAPAPMVETTTLPPEPQPEDKPPGTL
jgi:hypothetical protein